MAIKYLRQGAGGSGNGNDWTNAYTTWAAAHDGIGRGDTLYVADTSTSLGSITASVATSGVTTITVKKATIADHGTSTGWLDTYGDGQAVFGDVFVNTQYWIFDGATRTESHAWTAPTGYGFRFSSLTSDSVAHSANGNNSQYRYIDIGATYDTNPGAGTIAGYGNAVKIVYNQQNITFHRCAMHNATHAIIQAAGAEGLTIEYCHIGPGWGKEAIRGGNGSPCNNWTIRYNRFYESSQIDPNDGSSGITAEIGCFGDESFTYTGNAIYGNWFSNSKSGGRNGVIIMGGVGFSDTSSGALVYNNTFAGIDEGAVFGMIYLSGSGNVARNNLFYDCVSTTVSANTASDNDTAGADPFANYATLDLRLDGATSPGFSLSSPYNIDPNGVTRGSDGTWDVGAYEFDEGGEPEPPIQNDIIKVYNIVKLTNVRKLAL
jgi:hypothetical protein